MKSILFFLRSFLFLCTICCFDGCSKTGTGNLINPATQTPGTSKDEKFLLEIRITESFDSLVYTDSVSMVVLVNKDNQVIISEIKNFAPIINKPTYTFGSCTATWIRDSIGEINITSAQGTIDGEYGDSSRNLFLNFSDSAALSPGFNRVCLGSTPDNEPGIPITGLPAFSYFTLQPGQKVYETDSGDEFDRLTLIK